MLRLTRSFATMPGLAASAMITCAAFSPFAAPSLQFTALGAYQSGIFAQGGAEIAAFDARSKRLFVVNGAAGSLTVLDLSNPSAPVEISSLPFPPVVNSVAIHDGLVAVAVEDSLKTNPGKVVFFRADYPVAKGPGYKSVDVGSLPDMVTFTPDGNQLLVANEGEPSGDYTVDPEGSVSIIDLRCGLRGLSRRNVTTLGFSDFNVGGSRAGQVPAHIRAYGPGATLSQDLEPEYISVSQDGHTAYVTLQEHNAIAIVDIKGRRIEKLIHLGFKDHSLQQNALDASDRDSKINITTWPVLGMYQPDAIASFKNRGRTYLITANEGDVRDWPGYSEERRVSALALDPIAFPDAAVLRANANLGRLKVTSTLGDADGDGLHESLYSFGGRSFSIRDEDGKLIYDSGDELERFTAALYPDKFNAGNDDQTFDSRSDDKGPEPEGVTLGKVGQRTYAFLGLERIGGVAAYDLSSPAYPAFAGYVNNRNFAGVPANGTAGDLGPEGLCFIAAKDSPNGQALLVVANEVSGSVTVFSITPAPLARSVPASVSKITDISRRMTIFG